MNLEEEKFPNDDFSRFAGKAYREERHPVMTDNRGKGPKGYQREDGKIWECICEALTRSREVDASDIEVSVVNGHVTLFGTVSNRKERKYALEVAAAEVHEGHIHNHLKIKRKTRGVLDRVSGNTESLNLV